MIQLSCEKDPDWNRWRVKIQSGWLLEQVIIMDAWCETQWGPEVTDDHVY